MASTARERIANVLRDGLPSKVSAGVSVSTAGLRLTVEGFDRGGSTCRDRVPSGIGAVRGRRLIALARPVWFEVDADGAPDAWEIPMRLVRAEWDPGALRDTLETVKEGLGLPSDCDLDVEPRSLFVLEKGQFVPPRREPDPAGDVIGGLVVTLTTAYGGRLLIDGREPHGGMRGDRQAAAYRGGCTTEVTPVKERYAVLLSFDLRLTGQTERPEGDEGIVAETASLLREHFDSPRERSLDELRRGDWGPCSARYLPRDESPGRLVYLLDNAYEPETLHEDGLSEGDERRLRLLRDAAGRAGCETVLAYADVSLAHDLSDRGYGADGVFTDEHDGEHRLGERLYERIRLTRWAEPGGRLVEDADLLADSTETCASVPSDDLRPDRWNTEPYRDVFEYLLKRHYRRAAVIVWPRERGFANRAEASPGWALERVLARALAGDESGARADAAELAPSWGQAVYDEPGRHPAPEDRAWYSERIHRFHGLLGLALRAADAIADPGTGRALLRPFQIEDLTSADAPLLDALAGSYGGQWAADRVRDWFTAERIISCVGGRDRWIAGHLRQTCEDLHGLGGASAGTAGALLELAWESVFDDIETCLSWRPDPGYLIDHLDDQGEPIAAVLTSAVAIGADDVRDRVCHYLLRQPPELATALEVPVLHALGEDGDAGFEELAADCAARIRDRLALTRDVPGGQPARAGGLTSRERQARDRDTADLEWLTVRWRLAA